MTLKFYCIAHTALHGDWGKANPVVVEEHSFNLNEEGDRETLEDYVEDLNEETFEEACRTYLNESGIDWDQIGVNYLLFNEKEYQILKSLIA